MTSKEKTRARITVVFAYILAAFLTFSLIMFAGNVIYRAVHTREMITIEEQYDADGPIIIFDKGHHLAGLFYEHELIMNTRYISEEATEEIATSNTDVIPFIVINN